MTLTLLTYDKNKINYIYENVKLSLDEILPNFIDSKTLVLIDDCSIDIFIKKKYLRFFAGEKYNLDKVCYLLWYFEENKIDFNDLCLKLPKNIKYIKLNNHYNKEPNYIPNSVTHLIFGINFNSNIDNLPFSIEYLVLNHKFNKPIDNLPGALKKLIFNSISEFNQNLDNLPNFLEYLFLPSQYSKKLDNLPNFLIHIEINSIYDFPLNNLPNSIEKINYYLSNKNNNNNNDNYYVPNNYRVEKINYKDNLYVENVFVKFPKKLKYLDLTHCNKLNFLSEYVEYKLLNNVNQHVKKDIVKKTQPLDNLPDELRVIKFPLNYNLIQISKIPQNIVKIWFSNPFNQSIDKLLNPNFGTNKPKPETKLTHLIFGEKFNNNVNYLPDSLTHLYFGDDFNKSVDNLPNSLLFLSFGKKFNRSVDKLPNSLLFISFGDDFNSTINNLPNTIKDIEFGKNFSQSLNNLKDGLKTIKFLNIFYDYIQLTYGYNAKDIDRLPISLEKIYIPKIINSYNPTKLSPVLEKYVNLIEYY